MNDTRTGKKDKKQYIQVFVRVRPINNAEKTRKSVTVVDTPSNKEVVVRERLHDKFTKKFTFDKVFGPRSKQIEVYNAVVSPMLEEVLAGYNCTVFAYGQTGTGKTFTMEGTENDQLFHWQTDTNAGVIPRALSHLFDELSSLGVQEYSVRVSFIEIYNEEIYDLLSPNDDAARIRIYEDPTKKGAVIIHGTEEVSISNKKEVFKILKKGSEKRQTAATLMNARSSRSHTILSITVHIKENSINGEELLKTGKLNLVDLAGSENIGRSGAVDRRAREAGNINQSLLTLGRVITALVENTPHIPYRESKLTRLLQESLGGRTRTSIIATISPASINVEETLSTLDYAYRAKNITNRPEINQKFSKKALLREYTEEIEKLKKDLIANRERNGIYLTPESYNEMQSLIEFQSRDIQEKLNYITALEESMNSKQQIFIELKSRNSEQAHELINVKSRLETTVDALMFTSSRLVVSEQEKEEQKHLVEKYLHTENILLPQVQTVLDVADTATTDVHKLHEKIYRKIQIGQRNNRLGQQFKDNMKERIRDIATNVSTQTENLIQFWTSVKNRIDGQSVSLTKDIDKSNQVLLQELINSNQSIKNDLKKTINDSYFRYQQWLESENKNVTNMTSKKCNMLNNISIRIAQKFHQLIKDKILEDLRVLNSDFSEEVDNLVVFMKETGMSASKCSAEEQSRLNSVISEITELVKDIGRYKNNAKEKRANFVEMMENLQRCFNEVQKEEEENYISECNILSCIDKTSNIINNETSDSYKMRIEKQNVVERKMQNDLQTGKQVVLEGTDKSRLLVENAIAQSKMLISEFQANLDTNCATLTSYKNYAERSSREMQEKMEEDKNLILSAINDMYEKMCNATDEHVISLSDCKMAFRNVLTEMSAKLESENIHAANTNSTITAKVQALLNQIDKFFTDDLYRDVPTGLTPAKKNFQYSKKLIKTSPHERLLKRYRQTLEDIEHIESEPIILPLNDSTPTKEAVSGS